MAGRGPAPASSHTRKSNDKQSIKLVSDGKLRGRALPSGVLTNAKGEAEEWHPATVKWWDNWRRSPQALRMMTAPDWDFLLDTALMHHQMWITRRFELAGEIRLRVQQFGATPEARARLRVEISAPGPTTEPTKAEPKPEGTATVTSIEDRRSRLAED
jgi:hypothetical protein